MRRKSSTAYKIVKVLFLGITLILIAFPFYWMLITSFKTTREMYTVPVTFFPRVFSLDNYRDLFATMDFGRFIRNSIVVSLVATASAMVFSVMGAYVLSRFQFKGKKFIVYFYLMTQMLPSFIGLAPLYQTLLKWGMIDYLPTLMILNCTYLIPYSTITLRGFLNSVPRSLEESAMIDGANRLRAIVSIIFPLILPGFSATAIFGFVQAWNDLFGPIMYMNRAANYTIPVALNTLIQKNDILWGKLAAGTVIAVFPTIIMFAFAQKNVASGFLAGAIKG